MIGEDEVVFEAIRLPGPRIGACYRVVVANKSRQLLETSIQIDTRKSGGDVVERAGFSLSIPPGKSRYEDLRPSDEHDAFDVAVAFRPSRDEAMRLHSAVTITNAVA